MYVLSYRSPPLYTLCRDRRAALPEELGRGDIRLHGPGGVLLHRAALAAPVRDLQLPAQRPQGASLTLTPQGYIEDPPRRSTLASSV